MTTELAEAAKSVPGIEVQADAPAGAKAFLGPYYADEAELLKRALRSLRDRESMVVAPGSKPGSLAVYRKPRKEGK